MLQQYSPKIVHWKTETVTQERNFRYLKINTVHKLLDNYLFKTDCSEQLPFLEDILLVLQRIWKTPALHQHRKASFWNIVLLKQNIKLTMFEVHWNTKG